MNTTRSARFRRISLPSGIALMSGWTTRFDASQGSGLPRIVSLMPRSRPSIDTGPPPAICTLPPTGRRCHRAAVDVEQFAFQAMLGEDATVLGDPQKCLGSVDRRVGNAQFIGGGILRANQKHRESSEASFVRRCLVIYHAHVDTAIQVTGQGSRSLRQNDFCFLTTRKRVCYEESRLRLTEVQCG